MEFRRVLFRSVRVLSWTTAAVIVGLNLRLAGMALVDWVSGAGAWRPLILLVTVPVAGLLLALLGWVAIEPAITSHRRLGRAPVTLPEMAGAESEAAPVYQRILLTLDHTPLDRLAVSHTAAMARLHGAKGFLLHVEGGVTSQIHPQDLVA